MKLKAILIGGLVALVLSAGSANAAIMINVDQAGGTGALSGFDIFRIFANLTPTGTEAGATGIQSIDGTVDTSASNTNLKFKFADLDLGSDQVNDADVIGKTMPGNVATTNTNTVGTFFRTGGASSFNIVKVVPSNWDSDPDQDGTSDFNPPVDYSSVKNFRVVGFNPTPDASGIGGNGGKGALIGLVVVPHTSSFPEALATINVAADKGVAYQFITPFPEPTSFGLVEVSAMGLLARRRSRLGGVQRVRGKRAAG